MHDVPEGVVEILEYEYIVLSRMHGGAMLAHGSQVPSRMDKRLDGWLERSRQNKKAAPRISSIQPSVNHHTAVLGLAHSQSF